MNIAQCSDIRELTAEELNAIAGGSLHVGISLGWIGFRVDITKDGMSGSVKVGDGKWHQGTIWKE
jgi:hypothetical protein